MSRFVAAGADGEPTEQDEKWLAAQKAIEATRSKPRVELGSQEGGKSLYETLQANKEKKQAAYEESLRIGNQFQSLDEDDVEFLDSVLESTRAQEAAVKRDTKEQLDAFRQQQLDAERKNASPTATQNTSEQTTWAVGRKRKKDHKALGGVKLRKSSSTAADKEAAVSSIAAGVNITDEKTGPPQKPPVSGTVPRSGEDAIVALTSKDEKKGDAPPSTAAGAAASTGLGLGAYSSDEDD
ncbi:Putative PSME3-interacting protein [Septoria linicola]|uniref:PSME3-interacting protein n=1 Tax=Septoria linicola TaxID=215465 RepID=A0A9Q9ALZ9_9PEZI|nr:putative PSME3-interacting protein [Septoria linicola]USW48381.1 Putative PSME3-interacting protein [Septoria linicola]